MAMAKTALTQSWQKIFDGTKGNVMIQATSDCLLYLDADPNAPTENPPVGIRLRDIDNVGLIFASASATNLNIHARLADGYPAASVSVASW